MSLESLREKRGRLRFDLVRAHFKRHSGVFSEVVKDIAVVVPGEYMC